MKIQEKIKTKILGGGGGGGGGRVGGGGGGRGQDGCERRSEAFEKIKQVAQRATITHLTEVIKIF